MNQPWSQTSPRILLNQFNEAETIYEICRKIGDPVYGQQIPREFYRNDVNIVGECAFKYKIAKQQSFKMFAFYVE